MGVSLHPFSIKEGLLISLLTHELDNYQDWLKLRDELGVDVNVDLSDNRIDFSSISAHHGQHGPRSDCGESSCLKWHT